MCLCTFKQDYESLSPTQHGSTGLSKKEIKPAGAGGERGGAGGAGRRGGGGGGGGGGKATGSNTKADV